MTVTETRASIVAAFLALAVSACEIAPAFAGDATEQSASANTSQALDGLRRGVDDARARRDFSAALGALRAQQDVLGDDPDFNYLLGVVALEAGDPQSALDALEKAVLQRPDFAGAWLDLAIAHTRLGDAVSAQAILAHVEETFDPPPALRAQIAAARRDLAAPAAAAGTQADAWHGDVLLLAGRSSNANAGLAVSGFSLTPLGGTPLQVTVAPDQRPRGDGQLQMRSLVYRDLAHADGSTTTLLGSLRGRVFAREDDYDFAEAGAGFSHARPLSPGRSMLLGGSLRHLRLGGDTLGTFYGGSVGVRQQWGGCGLQATAEYERRDYSRQGYVDADLLWAGAGVECRGGKHLVSAAARLGQDAPSSNRAGGDTTRLETSLLWRWQPLPRWSSELLVYYLNNRDGDPYSPLLEGGATRRVERLGQRLSISRALDAEGRWRAVVEVENTRDYSNLPIFRLEEHQISIGLRHLF